MILVYFARGQCARRWLEVQVKELAISPAGSAGLGYHDGFSKEVVEEVVEKFQQY